MDSLKEKHCLKISKLFDQSDFPKKTFYIDEALDGRDIILYGAGECSHWFVEIIMKSHKFQPKAVLDKAYQKGMVYEGIPAFHPDEYTPSEKEKKDSVVIISIGNQVHYPAIFEHLNKIGFQNILLLRDIYEIHNLFDNPPELREEGFKYYKKNKAAIMAAYDLLEDDESRELYTLSMSIHMQRFPTPLPARPRHEQYFPTDIPLTQGYDCFINCGSYDGDVIRLLNQTVGKVQEIVCFEPEPCIYQKLVKYLNTNQQKLADRILALPCAVHSHEAQMLFHSGTGLGSRISKDGNMKVQTTALDHVLPGFKPTFISMDVEGVEPDVLMGAEKMLRYCQPDLGICLYHSPNHLWEIPLYLHNLDIGYHLYLRNYTTFTTETVLYATA